MADIRTILNKILSASLGRDVRQAIHDGIETCYTDGKAGSIDLIARQEINVLDARMDSFASLPAGSTSGDAELADIRVGVDGITYDSAGDAVRSQVGGLKSDLTSETNARVNADNALSARITNKVAQPLDGNNQPTNGTSGQSLRTKGDGTTEWASVGLPTDAQTADAVSAWLDEHPEATTTVQDGAITNKKLANGIASSYYDSIIYEQYRKYDTDIYYTVIPVYDSDGEIIDPFFHFSEDKTPNEIARELKTDVTFNGAVNYKKTDGTWQVGNVISRGTPIFDGDITGTLNCNDAGYFSIGRDRTFKTFPIETTQQELMAADAYNVSEYYFRLVINGEPNDFTQIYDNELNIVDGLRKPYIAIGVTASKELVILACDGRTNIQAGLTAAEMAAELISLGVIDAVEMDGGGSTSLSFKSVKANKNDDGGGTVDRMTRFTFNIKKPNVNDFITEPFAEIGKQKQALRYELYPYINDIYGKMGLYYETGVTSLEEGTDLNDITKVGRYWAQLSSIAGTLLNCPTTASFIMTVEYQSGSQIHYTIRDNDGNLFVRRNHIYSNANHFTEWRKMCAISSSKRVQPSLEIPANGSITYEVEDSAVKSTDIVVATPHWGNIHVFIKSIKDGKISFELSNPSSSIAKGWAINYIVIPSQ